MTTTPTTKTTTTTPLTVDYFKKTYASFFKDVLEEKIKDVLERLKNDWITTTDDLKMITRDSLQKNNYPALFVDAVKPPLIEEEEEGKKHVTVGTTDDDGGEEEDVPNDGDGRRQVQQVRERVSIENNGNRYSFNDAVPYPPQDMGRPTLSTPQKRVSDTTVEQPTAKRLKRIGDAFINDKGVGSWRFLQAWNREELNSEISSNGQLPILERGVCKNLAEKLYKMEYKRQVVTGMPGIGKSLFVDYFSQFALKRGDAVLLETDRRSTSTTQLKDVRRLELLVPTKGAKDIEYAQVLTFSESKELMHLTEGINRKVGSRKCWNLIDYQDINWSHVLNADGFKNLWQVLFASPDRNRWKNFFQTSEEKGQEPILVMPVWSGKELETLCEKTNQEVVLPEEMDVLVSLFGPSPRYCFSQFCSEHVGKHASEYNEEINALTTVTVRDAKAKASTNKNHEISPAIKVCSSSELLKEALAKLTEPLREKAKKAAQIIRGRIMTPGVVEELENIHDSPTGSTCKSNVSSRLLVWGVQGNSFSMNALEHKPYVAYASPYIATVVLEQNSKQVLRSMARFFSSGDRNVGAGSGWMYENFLLKYFFPSLKQDHESVLEIIGSNSITETFTLPPSYNCCIFGDLESVSFQDGTMHLPTCRNLGAVDCFMLLGETLYLFQITVAANHSIVKSKLENLINLAKQKMRINFVKLVFVVPSWRKQEYLEKAQPMTEHGKIVRVTGDIKKDTKETLEEAVAALDVLDNSKKEELNSLLAQRKNESTQKVRRELKDRLAEELRKSGYQDNSLETWSVPRLLATYESQQSLPTNLVARQLVWAVDKDDMPREINS